MCYGLFFYDKISCGFSALIPGANIHKTWYASYNPINVLINPE